jgi:transposase
MIYERRSRLSGKQQRRLIDLFVAGATARAAAELAGVNRNTARTCYHRLRQLIASKLPSYDLSGEVEADESSFGGVRTGNRGRAAAGKVPVWGLFKRGGRCLPPLCRMPGRERCCRSFASRCHRTASSIDSFTAYAVLDVSAFHHRRVNPSKAFVNKRGHLIKGMENFWKQAKRHLRRFNGLTPDNFS